LIGMIFKLLDYRDQILQRFNTELRPILRPILWLRHSHRDQQTGIISVFDLVRDRKAAAPPHRMADYTECAAEQRVHWIPHRNLHGGGFVRLTSRDIPACLRSRGSTGARRRTHGGLNSPDERGASAWRTQLISGNFVMVLINPRLCEDKPGAKQPCSRHDARSDAASGRYYGAQGHADRHGEARA
jgi:hypothetical protein